MKVNWFKWVKFAVVLAVFIFSMTFLAKSVAQTVDPSPSPPAPEDHLIIVSREDMEKIKTEFLFMRRQVEEMQGRLKACNSLLYPGL